jgi:hypothetical protein
MPLLLVLVASLAAVAGQERSSLPFLDSVPGRVETAHLTVAIAADPIAVGPDGRVTLHVDVTPKEKMHVYAPEETRYIPVSLTVDANPRVRAGKAVYPKGERVFFAPLEETQMVFTRPFGIDLPVVLRPADRAGSSAPVVVKATLRYQACDDRVCYLPKDVALTWTLQSR